MPDLRALLEPRSIAIIGASPDPAVIRGKVQHVLQKHRFPGPIYPVSRSHAEVQGLKAYRTIAEVPGPVDLALVIIPAADVPDALEECARAGVRGAYIISSGFAEETGDRGTALQARIREIARRHDMAICGPNAEGFYNAAARVVATFSPALEHLEEPILPEIGHSRSIAVVSQSGGLGFSYFHRGRSRQLRFSHIVSTGNEAAVSAFDLAEWYLEEGGADVMLLYLEAIRDAPTFRRVAAKAADLGRPIVIAKIGRSEVGARAAASHTAALAGSDAIHDAMFWHYGIVRAEDMDEQLDIAAAFAFCKRPKGHRIAVLAGSGGSGVWMAELLATHGLEVVPLDPDTRAEIDKLIPPYGSSANPVDITAQAVRQVGYARLAEIIERSPVVDGIVIVGSLAYSTVLKRDAEALGRLARESEKPIVFCTFTLASPEAVEIAAQASLPVYTNMRNCAVAVRALADYGAFQERWHRRQPDETAPEGTAVLRRNALSRLHKSGRFVGEYESKLILESYGVPRLTEHLVQDEAAALRAAAEIGRPVALKIQARGLTHKTEIGGVALDLATQETVSAAYRAIIDRVRARQPNLVIEGVLVQPMAAPGVEMVVGITRDAQFGPMLMVGLGGIHVEVLKDVVFAPVPIQPAEAQRLVESLRGYKLLEGVRGAPVSDINALTALMSTLSRFAADFADEIAEIDLNPIIVHPAGEGLTVVDALIVRRGADHS